MKSCHLTCLGETVSEIKLYVFLQIMLRLLLRTIYRKRRNQEAAATNIKKADFSEVLPDKNAHKLDLQIKMFLARYA